jgi:hypothetical protein
MSTPRSASSTALLTAALFGSGLGLAVDAEIAAGQSDLTLEFGASQIGPPVGLEGENARFFMGGVRGSHYGDGGSGVFASVLFGQTLDSATGGSFLSGTLEGSLVGRWTPNVTGSFNARVLGYGTQEPFPYRAFAAEGGPTLRVRTPSLGVKLSAVGGVGLAQLKLWRVEGGASRVFENDLWRGGGIAEIEFGPVTSNFGIVSGWHRTPAGNYSNVGARVVLAGQWGLAELRLDRWDTPDVNETTGGLALIIPVGRLWSLRGFFGRTDPDPLTLAQPGSGGGGVLFGRSLVASSAESSASTGPYQIVEYGDEASRVRVVVQPSTEATAVAVLGDFTLWEPVAMAKTDDTWVVELEVPVGTHHFGFLVDDQWYVPADAPDVVPDEWGRLSATLVIEGVSR